MKTSEDYEYAIKCLLVENVTLIAQINKLTRELDARKRLADNDVWYWSKQECNYLDSMGNDMTILIYASDLKELLKGNNV